MVVDSVNEEAMKAFLDAVEKGDLKRGFELISDDVLYITAYGVKAGKNEMMRVNTEIFSNWPDRKVRLNSWAMKGNTVWVEMFHTMTHLKEVYGIPPTNRTIENQIVEICEFESGKIVEVREYEKKNEYLRRQMTE